VAAKGAVEVKAAAVVVVPDQEAEGVEVLVVGHSLTASRCRR
jgi:hypothetical protein